MSLNVIHYTLSRGGMAGEDGQLDRKNRWPEKKKKGGKGRLTDASISLLKLYCGYRSWKDKHSEAEGKEKEQACFAF